MSVEGPGREDGPMGDWRERPKLREIKPLPVVDDNISMGLEFFSRHFAPNCDMGYILLSFRHLFAWISFMGLV